MTSAFTITTGSGDLIAEEWTDSSYPGITIYNEDRQVAVIECYADENPPYFRHKIWLDDYMDPEYDAILDSIGGSVDPGEGFAVETLAGTITAVPDEQQQTITVFVGESQALLINGGFGTPLVCAYNVITGEDDYVTTL